MLLIKAPVTGRAEAVNTLVCHLEGASGIQPYLGPKGQMSPADNVPTDGLAGSGLMVSRGQGTQAVMAECRGRLLLAKLPTTSSPFLSFVRAEYVAIW